MANKFESRELPVRARGDLEQLFNEVKEKTDQLLDIYEPNRPKCLFANEYDKKERIIDIGVLTFGISYAIVSSYFLTKNNLRLDDIIFGTVAGLGAVEYAGLSITEMVRKIKQQSIYLAEGCFGLLQLKTIKITKGMNQCRTIEALAHEYAHYLQHKNFGLLNKKFSIFEEGFASEVEKLVCEDYTKSEDNFLFMYPIEENRLDSMKKTHFWICYKLKIPSNIEVGFNFNKNKRWKPDDYELGSAIFSIWNKQNEERGLSNLCSRILKKEFKIEYR